MTNLVKSILSSDGHFDVRQHALKRHTCADIYHNYIIFKLHQETFALSRVLGDVNAKPMPDASIRPPIWTESYSNWTQQSHPSQIMQTHSIYSMIVRAWALARVPLVFQCLFSLVKLWLQRTYDRFMKKITLDHRFVTKQHYPWDTNMPISLNESEHKFYLDLGFVTKRHFHWDEIMTRWLNESAYRKLLI